MLRFQERQRFSTSTKCRVHLLFEAVSKLGGRGSYRAGVCCIFGSAGASPSRISVWKLLLVCWSFSLLGGCPVRSTGLAAESTELQPSAGDNGADGASPIVWIICGLSGDQKHDSLFTDVIRRLQETLHRRFLVSHEDIRVLYGSENPPYGSICNRATLQSSLQTIARHVEQNPGDVWLILLGHANSLDGGVFYNLPGDDVSGRELGEFLQIGSARGRLAIVLTTAAAGRFAAHLGGPHRAILSATEPADPDNRTEFPLALVEALRDNATDANKDGWIDLLEIFQATRQRVDQRYSARGWVKVEEATLDGDGDGRATRRPSFPDARGAENFRIKYSAHSEVETNLLPSDQRNTTP